MSSPGNATVEHGVTVDYQKIQNSVEFRTLKSRQRRFVFPVTVAALLWYCGYVLLAAFAESFMAARVFGNITMGIVLGLLQIVTTFVVAIAYVRYSNRVLDPGVARLRASVEGPDQAGAR